MTAPDRGATYQIALASTGSSTHDAWYPVPESVFGWFADTRTCFPHERGQYVVLCWHKRRQAPNSRQEVALSGAISGRRGLRGASITAAQNAAALIGRTIQRGWLRCPNHKANSHAELSIGRSSCGDYRRGGAAPDDEIRRHQDGRPTRSAGAAPDT